MFHLLPNFSGDWRRKVWDGVVARINFILALVLVCTFGGWLGKYWMVFEWMSHFRAQYFWIGLLGMAVMASLRKWRWMAMSLLIAIINGLLVLGWYFGKPMAPTDGTPVRFFLANVEYSRIDHGRLVEMIRKEKPDVVVLEEIQDPLVRDMAPLHAEYPFRLVLPRDDAFGIAVYSKLPMKDAKDIYYGASEVPTIMATLKTVSGDVLLFATHPLPPGKRDYFAGRNEHLKLMAQDLAKRKGRIVVIGDLNVTSWSPYYRDFVAETGLLNARQGFGLHPSWPTKLPPLMIPIDQFLYSPGLTVRDFRTGASIGSDHLPLIVELMILAK